MLNEKMIMTGIMLRMTWKV